MSKRKFVVHELYERLWHWSQVALFIVLFITGMEIHSTINFLGFEFATTLHHRAGWALVVLEIFTIFWHFTSGEWRTFLPTSEKLFAQIRFYSIGIMRGEEPPCERSMKNKLNPLQRMSYLFLFVILFPLQIITGIYYWGHPHWSLSGFSLEQLATTHLIGAAIFASFIIVHIYMAISEKALGGMITGIEELEID